MDIIVSKSSVCNPSPDTIPNSSTNVTIYFQILKLLSDADNESYDCKLTLSYDTYEDNLSLDKLKVAVVNELVSRLNAGTLSVSWMGNTYNRQGSTVSSVSINYTTFCREVNNDITINSHVDVTPDVYSPLMEKGVTGFQDYVKSYLVTNLLQSIASGGDSQ